MADLELEDLFKSELEAVATDEPTLLDCPHCETPITKSQVQKMKGMKSKSKTTVADANTDAANEGAVGGHVDVNRPDPHASGQPVVYPGNYGAFAKKSEYMVFEVAPEDELFAKMYGEGLGQGSLAVRPLDNGTSMSRLFGGNAPFKQ